MSSFWLFPNFWRGHKQNQKFSGEIHASNQISQMHALKISKLYIEQLLNHNIT